MISLNLTPPIRWGLNLLILLAGVILLRLGQGFFIPPVIALLLAAVLWPGAGWLHQKLRLPWSVACLTVVSSLILLNLVVTMGFTLAAARLLQGMPNPNSQEGQQQLYTQIREKVQLVSPFPLDENDTYWPQKVEDSRLFHYVQETIQKNINNILLSAAIYGNSWIWQWVLIMFILLFLLLEGRMLSRRAVEIVGPSKEVQEKAGAALSDMAHQVRSFLMWRTVVNVLLGLCVGVFYAALGLKEPWTWALLTAVLCYVPYLGPIVAGVPAVIDAFLSCPSPWYAMVVLLVYIVMITVEGYIVVPVVMGRSMEMNATTVMLACLFWELIWGLPGLFMAMPLMAAIKAVCAHMPEMRPWANLMSLGETEEPPEFKPDPKPGPSLRRPDLEALSAVVGELPADEPPASASSPRIGE